MSDLQHVHPLDLVAQQLNEVSLVLAQGDAQAVEAACAQLPQLATQTKDWMLAQGAQGTPTAQAHAQRQLQHIGALMADLRLAIGRHTLMAERALQIVVPAAVPEPGYAKHASLYGRGPRQSGVLARSTSA